jgi:hypothetical protein
MTSMIPRASGPVVGSGTDLPGAPLLPRPYLKSRHKADDRGARLAEHALMSLDLVLYTVLRVSAVVTVLCLAAVFFLTGGWEAAVAALALAAGIAFSLSLVVLLIGGEGTSDRARP